MEFHGFTMDAFQEESIKRIEEGKTVIVSAPTGSGKTVIAEYVIEKALRENFKVIYTSPIKALSNQKFRNFNEVYGDKVGIQTGDVTINAEAPILIMTTEIFRNMIYESPERLQDITHVIFDEVHFIDDVSRGTVWEESIIFAPAHIQFVCLSATIPNLDNIAEWISSVRKTKVETISENKRVVPLYHHYYVPGEGVVTSGQLKKIINQHNHKHKDHRQRFHFDWYEVIEWVKEQDHLPAIYFVFSRKVVEDYAYKCRKTYFLNKADSQRARDLYMSYLEKYDLKSNMSALKLADLVANGVAFHHAGMIPTMKEVVERMFTSGYIKLVFATETFALGINMPARSVIFDDIRKYDGVSFRYMKTRDYYQMAGRAGRRGMDVKGFSYTNIRTSEIDPILLDKVVYGQQEKVISQFNLSFNTIINLYGNLGEGIYEIHEKNFANFNSGQKSNSKAQTKFIAIQNKQLANKIKFLKRRKYIGKDGKPTDKGNIARQINGYELQVTEIYMSGEMQNLSAVMLAVLFSSIVYSPRKQDESDALGHADAAKMRKNIKNIYKTLEREMEEERIDDVIEPILWKMQLPVYSWATGKTLEEIEKVTNILPGDIIRNLRMTVQLLRQFRLAVPEDEFLCNLVKDAELIINRNEVDAEKQLRMGISAV